MDLHKEKGKRSPRICARQVQGRSRKKMVHIGSLRKRHIITNFRTREKLCKLIVVQLENKLIIIAKTCVKLTLS